MRIDDIEQVLGEAWKFRINLELNSGGQERKSLEQPLDVRICAFVRSEPELARELGKLGGKLRSELAQVAELSVVVTKQS
jgi:hypothetical protein